ncbi:MAG TPA: hypothetical protein VK616_16145 [Flavitalea sp.]|nr:hypothetical protein [Flavitalea sp.]
MNSKAAYGSLAFLHFVDSGGEIVYSSTVTAHTASIFDLRKFSGRSFLVIFIKSTIMKASSERKLIRWLHIILSIPLVGYIYGPVSTIPVSAMIVRWIMFPIVVLSGFWMWKGQAIRKWFRKKGKLAYSGREGARIDN